MEQILNKPISTLNGGINDSVTSLVVTSAATFPTIAPFTILIGDELLRVTNVSGTTFTVTRGSESSIAASHADLATVTGVISADVLNNMFKEMYQVGGYASRPSTARAGTIYHATDVNIKWRHNGTNWDTIYPTYVPYADRPQTGSWSDFNWANTTWTSINEALLITQSDTTMVVRGKTYTLPAAPYTITMCLGPAYSQAGPHDVGIGITDGTKCKIIARTSGTGQGTIQFSYYATTTTNPGGASDNVLVAGVIWLRFEDNNTHWKVYGSVDGANWEQTLQEARNTSLTPTSIGILHSRPSSRTMPLHTIVYAYKEA